MKTLISIPAYWGRADNKRQTNDLVFDHPTPLGSGGTLARCLDSLKILSDDDYEVLIVLACTTPEIIQAADKEVRGIIDSVGLQVPVHLFNQAVLDKVKAAVSDISVTTSCLSLSGYSHVRNMQLVSSAYLHADIAFYLDDDEVIDDPLLLTKIKTNVSNGYKGFAGYYRDKDEQYLLPLSNEKYEKVYGKRQAMNDTLTHIMRASQELVPTPCAFGGCMVITPDLWNAVCFDPAITRGEDIDFLLNCMLKRYTYYFDRNISIKHLPPDKPHSKWQQLEQDIIRFAYQRDKAQQASLSLDDFMPYPGMFWQSDLYERIEKTCNALSQQYQDHGELKDAQATLTLPTLAKHEQVHALHDFNQFNQSWCEMMKIIPTLDKGIF